MSAPSSNIPTDPEVYRPGTDDEHKLMSVIPPSSEHVITLFHGTTKQLAVEFHGAHTDGSGTVSPHRRCGKSGDFGWGGENSAFYLTPSRDLAVHYATQAAEYNKTKEIAIIEMQLDRRTCSVYICPDLKTWQEIVFWGWFSKLPKTLNGKTEPAEVAAHHQVYAGWVSKGQRINNVPSHWPVKYHDSKLPGGFTYDFQFAVLDQGVLDHAAHKKVTFETV